MLYERDRLEPQSREPEPAPRPVPTRNRLLELQATAGNRAVSRLLQGGAAPGNALQRTPAGVTWVDPPVEADGQLDAEDPHDGAGLLHREDVNPEALPRVLHNRRACQHTAVRTERQHEHGRPARPAQFTAAFSEYVEEIARRLSTQGDALDPHDAANVVATSRGVSFHSDSTAGSHTIHTYPSAGNVRVLNDAEFLTFKEVGLGYILYGNPRDVTLRHWKVQGTSLPI